MALCLDALARSLVPSSATRPSLTKPAVWQSRSTSTNSALKAARWAAPELADGLVVGPRLAGQEHEVHVALTALLELAAAPDAVGVAVQQHREHQRRVIGRLASGLVVRGQQRGQVELVDQGR